MEVFFVYLWLKLDDFVVFWRIIAGLCILGGIGFLVACDIYSGTPDRALKIKSRQKISFIFFFASFFLFFASTCIPSQKETALLVGTHYAVALRDSPEGVKVVSLIRKKANQFLDEQLKETK